MPGFRDVPLTQYVKKCLREKYAKGETLADLEADAKVSAGFFSQVLGGSSGVGPTSGDGIARVLGLKSYDDLHVAAYEWWTREGKQLYESVEKPEMQEDPEIAKAIDAVRRLVSPEVITQTLGMYPNVKGQQTWDWWVQRFAEVQRSVDKKLTEERRVGRKAKRTASAKRRKIRDVADRVIERKHADEAPVRPTRGSRKTA